MVQRRPFHETIVDFITHVNNDDLGNLARLIMETDIKMGYDEIIKAWTTRLKSLGRYENAFCVLPDLIQRRKAWQDSLKEGISFPSTPG